ncbi:hypothetical protein B0H14DRAFT_2581989 [Mycena olivaceomarginata]|nr:hypothetical protein B0H14DRAFT_2581989 [Mycena olivaceomarginata]
MYESESDELRKGIPTLLVNVQTHALLVELQHLQRRSTSHQPKTAACRDPSSASGIALNPSLENDKVRRYPRSPGLEVHHLERGDQAQRRFYDLRAGRSKRLQEADSDTDSDVDSRIDSVARIGAESIKTQNRTESMFPPPEEELLQNRRRIASRIGARFKPELIPALIPLGNDGTRCQPPRPSLDHSRNTESDRLPQKTTGNLKFELERQVSRDIDKVLQTDCATSRRDDAWNAHCPVTSMPHKPNLLERFPAQGSKDDTIAGVPDSGGLNHPAELQRTRTGLKIHGQIQQVFPLFPFASRASRFDGGRILPRFVADEWKVFFFDLAGQPSTQGLVQHSRPGTPLEIHYFTILVYYIRRRRPCLQRKFPPYLHPKLLLLKGTQLRRQELERKKGANALNSSEDSADEEALEPASAKTSIIMDLSRHSLQAPVVQIRLGPSRGASTNVRIPPPKFRIL